MKKNYIPLVFVLLFCVVSCSSKVSTSIKKSYKPLDYTQEVVVIGLSQEVPDNAEVIGRVMVGDTGFSIKCDFYTVVERAKIEARKVGGNAIKITVHKKPDLLSSCHRIIAEIIRVDNIDNLLMDSSINESRVELFNTKSE